MRTVVTPMEQHRHDGFSQERMNRALDEANLEARERERIVFEKLPSSVRACGQFPRIGVERSARFRESVALVVREKKRRLLVPYMQVRALDIWLHDLPDLADELEFFEQAVVAGDSFQRTATSTRMHGKLVMRCDSGAYELRLMSDRLDRKMTTIRMSLFQWRELVALIRGFGLPPGRWRERNKT